MDGAPAAYMPPSKERASSLPYPSEQVLGGGDTPSRLSPRLSPLQHVWRSDTLRSRWMELAAILIMALAVMAILLTIYLNDGKPLRDWHLAISINALISIYSLFFKTCLLFLLAECLMQIRWLWFLAPRQADYVELFDNASRGPLGSLLLLHVLFRRARFNGWVESFFVALAALTVFLALTIDPFFQQIISYQSCVRPDPSAVASTSRLSRMYPSDSYWSNSRLAGQVNSAAFALEARNGLGPNDTCANGSTCSFDSAPYWTLGMCGSCDDLTSSVSESCASGFPSGSDGCTTFLSGSTGPTVSLTNGSFLHVITDNTSSQDTSQSPVGLSLMVLADYRKLSQYDLYSPSWKVNNPRDPHFGAAKCRLSPCAKRLRGNFTSPPTNVRNEVIMDTEPLRSQKQTAHGVMQWSFPSRCLSADDLRKVTTYKARSGLDEYDMCNMESGDPADPILASICNRCLFSMSTDLVQSLQGTWTSGESTNWTLLQRVTSDGVSYAGGNSLPSVMFFNDGSWISFEYISAVFDLLASVYSGYMRNKVWPNTVPFQPGMPGNQRAQGHPAVGQALTDTVCAYAHGGWAAMPIALFLMGVAVFVWVALEGRKTPGYMWKSSSLALMFHGLHPGVHCHSDYVDSDEKMQVVANELQVRLERTDEGLFLVPYGLSDSASSTALYSPPRPAFAEVSGGSPGPSIVVDSPRSDNVRPRHGMRVLHESGTFRPLSRVIRPFSPFARPFSPRRGPESSRFTSDVMTAIEDLRPPSRVSRLGYAL